jgi:hypothetical protein
MTVYLKIMGRNASAQTLIHLIQIFASLQFMQMRLETKEGIFLVLVLESLKSSNLLNKMEFYLLMKNNLAKLLKFFLLVKFIKIFKWKKK